MAADALPFQQRAPLEEAIRPALGAERLAGELAEGDLGMNLDRPARRGARAAACGMPIGRSTATTSASTKSASAELSHRKTSTTRSSSKRTTASAPRARSTPCHTEAHRGDEAGPTTEFAACGLWIGRLGGRDAAASRCNRRLFENDHSRREPRWLPTPKRNRFESSPIGRATDSRSCSSGTRAHTN